MNKWESLNSMETKLEYKEGDCKLCQLHCFDCEHEKDCENKINKDCVFECTCNPKFDYKKEE